MTSPAFAAAAVIAAAVLTLTGCGGGDEATPPDSAAGVAPVAGMCAPEAPDCVDTVVAPDEGGQPAGDEFDGEHARSEAEALLGTPEADLSDEVRISRRGEESFMLTEDYVLGRMTVELDEIDEVFVVTAVTVELPEGPVTFQR